MNVLQNIRALFRAPPPPAPPAEPAGNPLYRQTAVYRVFDWLAGIPDPDEVLRRTGRTRANLRELLRDAEVTQTTDTRREAVIATPWRLEPEGAEPNAFILAELEPHIPRLIAAAWQATLYGYSVTEVVYAPRGGRRIGLASVNEPPFEWFRPLPDGTVRYFPLTGEGGVLGLDCDPRRFLLTQRNAEYRNPYGQSLLSVLYWPVTWRLQGWQLWLDFLETFGQPIVIGKTGSYEAFVQAMQAQGVKRTVGWQPTSPDDAITTIQASVPGEFERLESALDRVIQRVMLGQTLTSDNTNGGSNALGKVHNEVRDDRRRADLRMVSGTVQRLVDTMWSLNSFPGKAPRFVMEDDAEPDLEVAQTYGIMSEKMGVRWSPEHIAERFGLNVDDFKIADPTPVAPAPNADPAAGPAAKPEPKNPAVAAQAAATSGDPPRFTPQQQVIEDGIAALSAPLPLSVADFREVIIAASDRNDLEARLATLLEKQTPAFAASLAAAIFAGNVLGYLHASNA